MNSFSDLKNIEAEKSVVCFAMQNEENASYVTSKIEESDITDFGWNIAYKVVKRYYDKYSSVSRSAVETVIKDKIENYEDYLREIDENIHFVGVSDYDVYSSELKSLSEIRKIYRSAQKIQSECLDDEKDKEDIIAEAQSFGSDLFSTSDATALTPEEILKKDYTMELIDTGVPKFDEIMYPKAGRALGGTHLIFARPGHGKTFYLFMLSSLFQKAGANGIHFSLEDTETEMAKRAVDQIYTKGDREAVNRIKIETEKVWLHEIVQSIRYYKYHHDIKFANVDHLGRVKVKGIPVHNRNASQIEVSGTLTDLCKELDIAGQFCVQPNKADKRKNGWENLLTEDDLKGATEIFEDAFVVTTLFRPNQYRELRMPDGAQIKLWNYGKKNIDESNCVSHYDSIFANKIKDRRSRLENTMVQMIQDGSYRIVLKEDFEGNHTKKKIEYNEEEVPF